MIILYLFVFSVMFIVWGSCGDNPAGTVPPYQCHYWVVLWGC